jgi:pyrroline-5-carboxylate reductase
MYVGLIGAGNMARAMARGWGEPVLCSDSGSGRARTLATELAGRAVDTNVEVAQGADVVVLAHKPAQLGTVAAEIASHAKVVLSVLGGVDLARLQSAYPGTPVFRTMPNTPVEVRQGVICYAPGDTVPSAVEAQVVGLLERLGTVVKLAERHIDAASAVMGVGPAYQALLAEAQVDAGVRHGLPPALASALVADTMSGTAALLAARGYDTLAVRREVTSPGGSTARGLAALERAGVRAAFQDAADGVLGWSPA